MTHLIEKLPIEAEKAIVKYCNNIMNMPQSEPRHVPSDGNSTSSNAGNMATA